jgi:hypothetical protein
MEENLSVLVDAKTEYTKQLTNILVPHIFEGINSIYDETTESCKIINDNATLMRFQEKLSLIPKWNQDMLTTEYERIMKDSGCDWLDELVTAVFLSHTKILTAIKKSGKKQKKINLKIPKIDHFIHKCYIECAREFWRNPYLFSQKCSQAEYHRNIRESQKIICTTIEETIRKLLPVKNILKEYLGEEGDSDSETSFIDKGYRDNLRKMVKKEIEICQGKDESNSIDNDVIEEENLEKQEDIDEIKEVISNNLYTKDLSVLGGDNENVNQIEGIIDLDDIEEISLMEMNRKNINQSNTQENTSSELPYDNSSIVDVGLEKSSLQEEINEEQSNTPLEEEQSNTPLEEEQSNTPLEEERANTPFEEGQISTSTPIEGNNEEVNTQVKEQQNTLVLEKPQNTSVEENILQEDNIVQQNNNELVKETEVENFESVSEEISLDNTVKREEDNVDTTTSFSKNTELDKLNIQNNLLIDDLTDEEVDVSTLNLKKMDINTLDVQELNFDDLDNSLVEIDEDNSLEIKSEVKKELESTTDNIKKIVIDDGKTNNLKKFTKDTKKNFSFFD